MSALIFSILLDQILINFSSCSISFDEPLEDSNLFYYQDVHVKFFLILLIFFLDILELFLIENSIQEFVFTKIKK